MSSLLALLSQQTPSLQTRKGLILLGLQNDFASPDGKLPVNGTDYLDRLAKFVTDFRDFGELIWVRSEFESTRPVNGLDTPGDTVIAGGSSGKDEELLSDKKKKARSVPSKKSKSSPKSSAAFSEPDDGEDDEELFLSRTSTREPCCLKGTRGAEYADRIKHLVRQGKDMQVVKTHYSAFGGTSLLLTLRSKLITELYVAGNMTNLSVYATAMDAARYGIRIILVEDCLGYRRQDRHKLAIKQLCEIMSAEVMTSSKAIDELRNPPEDDEESEESDEISEASLEDDEVEPKQNTPASNQASGALEADSDESDGEVELPIVRRSGTPGRMTGLYSQRTGKDSLRAAFQDPKHHSQHSQPSHSRAVSSDFRQASRSFQEQAAAHLKKPKIDTGSFRHNRRLGILDSPESPPRYAQPWLDIIPRSLSSNPNESKASPRRSKHPGLAALSAISGISQSTVEEYEEMMRRAQEKMSTAVSSEANSKPLFGEEKEAESGGSKLLYDLLPSDLADVVFDRLKNEVSWQTMRHQTGKVPRLVCCQGAIGDDGSMPVYRHPSDQTLPLEPWTATVDQVKKAAEKAVGPLNHGLIQLYRGGNDFISEHSDKTLDIVPGSKIVNVSFGAQRTMRLRTKRGATPTLAERTTHRVPLPHNSMITMSLETNAQYLHGINADKRPHVELVEDEKAHEGHRISLTFRHIGTFLSRDSKMIWGQGAVAKTKDAARPVVNGDAEQSESMVKAFGAENAASSINWAEIYGNGTDVLHLK